MIVWRLRQWLELWRSARDAERLQLLFADGTRSTRVRAVLAADPDHYGGRPHFHGQWEIRRRCCLVGIIVTAPRLFSGERFIPTPSYRMYEPGDWYLARWCIVAEWPRMEVPDVAAHR